MATISDSNPNLAKAAGGDGEAKSGDGKDEKESRRIFNYPLVKVIVIYNSFIIYSVLCSSELAFKFSIPI
jgi:hypothetical protein